MSEPLTEEWLASVGFRRKTRQERQPFDHWEIRINTDPESVMHDLYIETTLPGFERDGEHVNIGNGGWFLWLGRSHAFIHLRHIKTQREMIDVIEAISGKPWDAAHHKWGSIWPAGRVPE